MSLHFFIGSVYSVIMKENGLRQIAQIAGCSCSTVSRVLNNRDGISSPVRKKILSIARQLSYRKPRTKRIIALLAALDHDGFDMYTMRLLREIVLKLHQKNFHAEVLFDDDSNILGQHYISGVISLHHTRHMAELLGTKCNIPMVCVNDYDNLPENVCKVVSDDREAIIGAVNYLIAKKCFQICLLVPDNPENLNTVSRINAFNEYARHTGLQEFCHVIYTRNNDRPTIPVDTCIEMLPANCQAVISTIEAITPELYKRLKALRPEIRLLSWSYSWQQASLPSDLPCMQQDFDSVAESAVQTIVDLLNNKKVFNTRVPYIFKPPQTPYAE